MKKTAIVSCYFQHNYGSMLQAYATQMALDKLGYENETIDISGFNGEIKKAKLLYFAKASLTSDILLSKLGIWTEYDEDRIPPDHREELAVPFFC